MQPDDRAAIQRQYADRYEAMERLRVKALKEMTDAEALRQMDLLLTAGPPWRETRETSGLVEQQRLFMKARRSGNT